MLIEGVASFSQSMSPRSPFWTHFGHFLYLPQDYTTILWELLYRLGVSRDIPLSIWNGHAFSVTDPKTIQQFPGNCCIVLGSVGGKTIPQFPGNTAIF